MADTQHEALARLPYIDAVVVYEGEIPLRRICEQVRDGSGLDFGAVPNTYFQRGTDVVAPTFPPPVGIDTLPTPEFDVAELNSYLKPVYLPVYVSKGCYWGKCKFCDYTKLYTPGQAKTHAWAVFRPVDTLVADIKEVTDRHGVDRVFLISDAISPKYYRQLSESVIASGLEVEFLSYCRVEKTYDLAFFQLLHRAGVRHLIFGVEATDDRILKLIDKGNTVHDVRRSIRYATVAGINVIFNLIPDYPTITLDEVERTLGFIRDNIDFIYRLNCHFFNLSANSSIVDEADEHGITVEKDRYVQTNHGVHSLGFTREAGLTPAEAARVRRVFGMVTSDIELYRRTRHLLAKTRHEGFNWGAAEFVLAEEAQVYRVPFDPAQPSLSGDLPVFERQSESVEILASPPTQRYLRTSAPLRAILEVAERQNGFFSLQDIVALTTDAEGGEHFDVSSESALQTAQTLLQEGFIRSMYHPWLGGRSQHWADTLLTGNGGRREAPREKPAGPTKRRDRWRAPDRREILRSTAMLAAVDRAITDKDVDISEDELQRSANAFRASYDLHSAADTRVWLEANGMTDDDLETYVSRCVALEKLRSASGEDGAA